MSEYFSAQRVGLVAVAAAAIVLAGCNKGGMTTASSAASSAPTPAKDDVVATVNGTTVSRSEYDIYTKSLLEGKNPPPELTAEQKGQILDQLISMELLSAQGEKDGLDKNPDVVARMQLVRMRILSDQESVKYIKDHEPTDADLHAEYDRIVANGEATEYHARHILVDSKEKADKLIKKIQGGAKFEDVAKTESTDPSKAQGGDLGWFNPNGMVKPFADAVRKLKKGEMTTEPVQSQFGWHVIKVEDTREPSFDQLKTQITNRLAQKKLFAYIEDMKKTATVDKKL
ncbi:MAG TPA: peptidylprolyl isomerase [Steroidobacteraceae bacterium]|jgi:peptidyl-prolyl cis-trans isomerase C